MDHLKHLESTTNLKPELRDLIKEVRDKISAGTHWYIALLEAIGQWNYPDEEMNRQVYRYLIAGEAFDWLLLLGRLGQALDGAIPEKEMEDLLFNGIEPSGISNMDFKNYLGPAKYKAHLNYYYGIEVEEALIQAVEDEVRKGKKASGYLKIMEEEVSEEAFRRLYGKGLEELLSEYTKEKGLTAKKTWLLYEWKEFVYWLFRLRLRLSDKSRCASDTKKALEKIQTQRAKSLLKNNFPFSFQGEGDKGDEVNKRSQRCSSLIGSILIS